MPFASGNITSFCYTVAQIVMAMEQDLQANITGLFFDDAKSIIDAAKSLA